MSKKRKFKPGDHVFIVQNPHDPHGWEGYEGIYVRRAKRGYGLGHHVVVVSHAGGPMTVRFHKSEIREV